MLPPTPPSDFTCKMCSYSFTSSRIDWDKDFCRRCITVVELNQANKAAPQVVAKLYNAPSCTGCGSSDPAAYPGGTLCAICEKHNTDQLKSYQAIPPGVLAMLTNSTNAGTATPAPTTSRGGGASSSRAPLFNLDDLDTVHNAAETSAKLSRNSSKGPKMWSKGLRPGYTPIPGSSQPGAGPLSTRNNGSHSTRKSVGAKVQQTAPLKKLTVEWTLITSPNGNIRKRASDFLYKANTIYDLSLLYEDMLSQGVAALNRVFLQSPGSGSIEDYDLVETDYRLIHARTSTDLGVDFFDMTLSEALEACDQSPALADTYLEGKKSGAPVIANNYSPRIRITVSVNLTQYNTRVEHEKEAFELFEEEADRSSSEQAQPPRKSRKRLADIDLSTSDVEDIDNTTGSIELENHARGLPRRRLEGPLFDPTSHHWIEAKICTVKFADRSTDYKLNTSIELSSRRRIVKIGSARFLIGELPWKENRRTVLYCGSDERCLGICFKVQEPELAENNEVNAWNKEFVLSKTFDLARLAFLVNSFVRLAESKSISQVKYAIRIDTPTYLERVDNERPPVEVEDEEGLRSTTSFVNEFYATTYVYPVSYALDDINGTDEPLQPLQSLGDVVNALRHFALQEEEAAITRIQGSFDGSTFVFHDVNFAGSESLDHLDVSEFRDQHVCSSMCRKLGLEEFEPLVVGGLVASGSGSGNAEV